MSTRRVWPRPTRLRYGSVRLRHRLAEVFRRSGPHHPAPRSRDGEWGTDLPVTDDRNARYDAMTIEILRRVLSGGGVGLDIGANLGAITAEIVAAAPDRRHHAFEPIPALAEDLRIRFPTVAVHAVALAAAPTVSEFHHVVTNPGYSGLVRRRFDRPHEDVEIIQVPVGRLDDIVGRDESVSFVKIDVEGGELGVLQGGIETLARNRPVVVFEHGLGGSDFYGTRPEAVYDLLADLGLRVGLLDVYLAGGPPLSRDDFVHQFDTNENYYFVAWPLS